jgi:hypothetical protein
MDMFADDVAKQMYLGTYADGPLEENLVSLRCRPNELVECILNMLFAMLRLTRTLDQTRRHLDSHGHVEPEFVPRPFARHVQPQALIPNLLGVVHDVWLLRAHEPDLRCTLQLVQPAATRGIHAQTLTTARSEALDTAQLHSPLRPSLPLYSSMTCGTRPTANAL